MPVPLRNLVHSALAFVFVAVAVVTTFATLARAAVPKKSNILFILTEDQGAHAGYLGTPGLRTPHMDALAASGTVFTHAFVVYPVCSASKAALYTGLHNHTNGLLNNTLNYHKPARDLTPAERAAPLYLTNFIRPPFPTLIELLAAGGYYQGVTHKLHVLPNEKFPYDEFLKGPARGADLTGFIARARTAQKPWFYLYNISVSHRPFPNSDAKPIRVSPASVKLPGFLPDTPVVRQDWAEYLAALELADTSVGEALAALRTSGQADDTVVVFMGDHGPCFQHGKMTLHDLGLRVPLIVRLPGQISGHRTAALVTELDLLPTLLDYGGLASPALLHGASLRPVLADPASTTLRATVFAEISARGPLPNDGLQERSAFDGRWKLIYREKTATRWRQVQADSKDFQPWRNRTYAETVRVRADFPDAYRILTEFDPQSLDGLPPAFELYDHAADPDELRNLASSPAHRPQLDRLYLALRNWATATRDPAMNLPHQPSL
jgi:N-sulfoglucosamine sulfohydrolase